MAMSCAFQSDATYYASVSNPAETLLFSWDCKTGIPAKLEWMHGDVLWRLHVDPGQITQQGYYYDIDLRITTDGYQETAYSLKGKLTLTVARPSGGTFAAILEGAGTAWLVADGALTVDAP
jgi:hypothetical protein